MGYVLAAVAVAAIVAIAMWPAHERPRPEATGEPIKLKLDRQFASYKP
jgi:hypothetical protein